MQALLEPVSLSLSYKGERHYVQGADIWREAAREISNWRDGSFVEHICFRTIATGQVMIQPPGEQERFGDLLVRHADGTCDEFHLVDSEVPLQSRRPYDERLVTDLMDFERGAGVLTGRAPFPIEDTLISMIKAVCYRDGAPAAGSWLFVRMKSHSGIPESSTVAELRVEQVQQIKGRFAKFRALADDRQIADIDFCAGNT